MCLTSRLAVSVLLCAAVALATVESSAGKLMRCADEARSPCWVKAVISHIGSRSSREEESELCLCTKDRRCDSDWSTTRSVHTISLSAGRSTARYSMKFCQPRRHRQVSRCQREDTALQIAGFRDIPTNFAFFKCRCGAAKQLMLVARERTADNLIYEKYTCRNFLVKCGHNQTCASHSHNQTTHHCKCALTCSLSTDSGQSFCQ